MQNIKFVSDRVVVGRYGQPVVEPGYTEIAGVRLYRDQIVVGPHGQAMVKKGRTEVVQNSAPIGRSYQRRMP